MYSLHDLEPKKILIRMPNWIGDLVMATPVLSDVRKRYPKAHITAMSCYPHCELLRHDPDIDELFCFHKYPFWERREEKREVVEKIQTGHYDLGILLTHSFSSAWWFWRGKVQRRLGYSREMRSFFLTDRLPFPKTTKTQHLVVTYKMLLQPLGIPLSPTKPRLFLTTQEKEEAKELLKSLGIPPQATIVGINPGATYGSAKCWLPDRFRKVTEELLRKENVYILYFGDQKSSSLVKEICLGLSSRVVNLAGVTSIRELASLLQLCHVLLTNDSGPMHIAAALGTPLVALFGSTSEIQTGPYKTGQVIHKHVSCSPCYKRTCPIDFRCMKQIEVDEVVSKIVSLL